MSFSDLPSTDLDTDCCPLVSNMNIEPSSNLLPYKNSMKNRLDNQDQCESGLGSSLSISLDSNDVERLSVQCTDAPSGTDKQLQHLPVLDEDEGIGSLSSSVASLKLHTPVQPTVNVQTPVQPTEEEEEEEDFDFFQQDEDGDTLLHLSVIGEAPGVASTLIDIAPSTACLNIRNSLFQTPLHLAVLVKQNIIVRKLVTRGANLTIRDRQGNTPLHIACRDGSFASVKIILDFSKMSVTEKRDLLNMKNCEGLTCLHIAMIKRYFDLAKILLDNNAEVNLGDAKSGRTVLHYVVEQKDMVGVKLLLNRPEINIEAQTFKGETPLMIAYWRNYQEIVKKLKSKGAYFSYDLLEDLDDYESELST